jgi:hypothetical protein
MEQAMSIADELEAMAQINANAPHRETLLTAAVALRHEPPAEVAALVEGLLAIKVRTHNEQGSAGWTTSPVAKEAAASLTYYAARIAELEAEVAAASAILRDLHLDIALPLNPQPDRNRPRYTVEVNKRELGAARAFLARNTDGGGK